MRVTAMINIDMDKIANDVAQTIYEEISRTKCEIGDVILVDSSVETLFNEVIKKLYSELPNEEEEEDL